MSEKIRTVLTSTSRQTPVLYFRKERMSTGGGWEVEAGSSRVSERAPRGTACISSRGRRGSKGHKTGKSWKKTPSAARAACVARVARATQSRYSKKPLRTEPRGTACISSRGRRGSKGHRTGKAWKKTPSAARVACVARVARATQSRYSKKPLRTELYKMGRVQVYIHSYRRRTNVFGSFVAKIGYHYFSVFATPPGRHLIG